MMSALGLGRVKTPFPGQLETGLVSGCDRSDERLDPDDIHNPC
jgi:hypothetical protein